jgi:hypothetical protein
MYTNIQPNAPHGVEHDGDRFFLADVAPTGARRLIVRGRHALASAANGTATT